MALILQNDYLPIKYELSLEIDRVKPNFKGVLTLFLERVRHDEKWFKLTVNGHKLIILKAYIGEKELNISYDKLNQLITLQGEIQSVDSVTIEYIGSISSVDKISQTRATFKSHHDNQLIISTQTQPIFARQILPLIDDPNFKSLFQLTITTDVDLEVIANVSVKTVITKDKSKVWEFNETPPMLSSSFGFVVGDLDYIESSNCDVPTRIYGPKGELNVKKAQNILAIMEKLMAIAVNKFGQFPLLKLDIVGIPYLTEGAMENWGMITVAKDHLFNAHDLHLKQLLSHELVHQWMGNLVSFNSWRYMWLNESFATLVGNYFVTLLDGNDEAFKLELITINDTIAKVNINIWKFMNSLVIDNEITTTYLFNYQVYQKGIVILRMLVNMVNETVDDFDGFLAIIANLVDEYKFQSINPIEMWTFFNNKLDIDFMSFINTWLRYDKCPNLQINGDQVLHIEQVQAKPFHFPFIIKTVAGDIKVYIKEKSIDLAIDSEIIVINKDKISLVQADISKKIVKNIDVQKLNKLDCNVYLNDYKGGEFNKRLITRVNSK